MLEQWWWSYLVPGVGCLLALGGLKAWFRHGGQRRSRRLRFGIGCAGSLGVVIAGIGLGYGDSRLHFPSWFILVGCTLIGASWLFFGNVLLRVFWDPYGDDD